MTLDSAIRDYRRQGYCILSEALSPAELGSLTAAADALLEERVGYEGDDPGMALDCPAGTIVAFSSLTLHRSGANTTDRRRRAYICQYSPEPIIEPATGRPGISPNRWSRDPVFTPTRA